MTSHPQLLGILALVCLAYTGVQSVPRDADCSGSKGCFGECSGSDCEFLVSWKEDGENVMYNMSSAVEGEGWVALGFSADKKMGGDTVIGCKRGSDSEVEKFTGTNRDRTTPIFTNDTEIQLAADSDYENGVLTCRFMVPIRFASTDKPSYYLFARGETATSGDRVDLQPHGIGNSFISGEQIRSSEVVFVGTSSVESKLIKAHGSLMVISWIFLASVAIVAARYCKPLWTVLLFSEKVWFQIHRTCMILVFCLTAIGFILIFVEVDGWSDLDFESDEYLEGHPIMGIIVMILTVINPIMAFIRPHPNTPMRPIFNWAHWFVGTAAHILGVITILFGVQLNRADAPDYLIYILAGYVGWQVCVELALEMITYFGRNSDRKELYEMDGNGGTRTQKVHYEPEGVLTLKRVIFVVHFFVVTAIAAILVALIAVGKSELDD